MRFAILLPVYNEAPTLERVVKKLSDFAEADVVVVDDGSTDATPSILERLKVAAIIRHDKNLGYGQTLMDAFRFVIDHGYGSCVTLDADEQHEPAFIPRFLEDLTRFDIVSGSRYLNPLLATDHPPRNGWKLTKLSRLN